MAEWLGLEWWRFVWQPALAGGLIWLATTWQTTSKARGDRDVRLDSRQERELSRLDAENDELRRDRDTGWAAARGMEQLAHDRRHEHLNVVSALIALRRLVKGFLAGTVKREQLAAAMEGDDPIAPPRVPPLHEMVGKRSAE